MKFVKSDKGLCFYCDKYSGTTSIAFRALLDTAQVSYVYSCTGQEEYFKVEPKDQQKVENMIFGWAINLDDIKHALHCAERK